MRPQIAAAIALGARDVVTLGEPGAPAGGHAARARRVPHRARARCDAQVRARRAQPARQRAAALQRRHHPGAGGHRHRGQPGLARAVRRRGRHQRPAGHGPVRGVHARGAARGARRLPAGALERSHPARQRAARRRHGAADRDQRWRWASTRASRACAWWCPRARARSACTWSQPAAPAPRPETAAGLLRRTELLEALAERLATPAPGGMRCLALVRIDKFAALERVLGATASEEVFTRGRAAPARRRCTRRSSSAASAGCASWRCSSAATSTTSAPGASACSRACSDTSCACSDKSVSVTCTIGLSIVSPRRGRAWMR